MSGMDRLTELLDSLKAEQAPFIEGGPRHPSKKNAYFRALAEAYESGDLVVAHRRASQAAPAPSGGCEWCVDGVQADGETPCPCTQAAPAPSDGLREADARLREGHLQAMLLAAEAAEACAPSDEWSQDTKDTYYFAVRDAARAIRRTAALSAPAQEEAESHD